MDAEPYIVGWTTSEQQLRAALTERLPQVTVLRRMTDDRLVVRIPRGLVERVAALPESASVVRDERRHPDGAGTARPT